MLRCRSKVPASLRATNIVGKRVKIRPGQVLCAPNIQGSGKHLILCEFTGKNRVSTETEELHFALRFNANDGSSASLNGVPIFMGVTVGNNGISFEGRSINVKSSGDETVLETLGTPAFQNGLGLLLSAQPALKPFTSLATAWLKLLLARARMLKSTTLAQARLRSERQFGQLQYGSYVVVQCDDTANWDWDEYQWNRDTNAIESKSNSQPFHYNYMVFGVVPFDEPDTTALA